MFSVDLSLPLLVATAISTILFIRFLHKYFLNPYFLLQRYKKYKGGLCIYRPIIGIVRDIKDDEFKYGDSLYSMKKRINQDPSLRFVATPLLDRVFVTIHDPDLIKQFLNKEASTTVKYLGLLSNMTEFLKHGLVFTEGENWKRQRKLLSQVFHFDYMNNSLPAIRASAKEWIDKNCKNSSSSPCVVNVSKELKMYTSTGLWRIFFGEDRFDEGQSASSTVELVLGNLKISTELTLSPWNFIFGARFFKLGLRAIDRQFMRERKLIKEVFYSKFDQLRDKINQKRKAQQDAGDAVADGSNAISPSSSKFKNLIELLVEQSEGMSDLEIVSQIYTFFFAGTDTTSELLALAHYLLAVHPEAQAKLREEVLAHIGKTEDIKYDHIPKMEYLHAVIKETLRIGAPAASIASRIATQDFMLNDIEIKKGTVITASLAGVGHNPKMFRNPEHFRPERWLEKAEPGTIDTSTHLPFSAGSRRCIGEQLALIESKVMLCELVRQFKIDLKTPYELKMGINIVYCATPDVNVIYSPIS